VSFPIFMKGLSFPVHCKKSIAVFPTKQTLPGGGGEHLKLLPARDSLVRDIPAEEGKNANLFYSVKARGSSTFLRAGIMSLLDLKGGGGSSCHLPDMWKRPSMPFPVMGEGVLSFPVIREGVLSFPVMGEGVLSFPAMGNGVLSFPIMGDEVRMVKSFLS
jgi:hypothetical protein